MSRSGEAVSEPKERIQYLDLLKVLAIFGVVFLHLVSATLRKGDGSGAWHFANAVTALSMARLPLFFMISGALLMSSAKTLSISYTLKQRTLRLLVPLIAWSIVYVGWSLAVTWRTKGALDWATAIDHLKHIPGTAVTLPLWFMYALICMYIMSPLLKRMVDALSRDLVIYVAVLWAVFSCLLPTIATLVPESISPLFTQHKIYNLNLFGGYLGYFFIGYYLMNMERRVPKRWLLAIVLVFAAVIALGTWWKTETLGAYTEMFRGRTHVFTVVISIATFLLFKELMRDKQLGRFTGRVIGFLSPLVFGIYLSHALMVDLINSYKPFGSIGSLIAYYLAVLAGCVAISAALSLVKPVSYVFVGGRGGVWWKRRKNEHGGGGAG